MNTISHPSSLAKQATAVAAIPAPAPPAAIFKACFIDDAWAAPPSHELSAAIPDLRTLFTDNPDVLLWFVNTYALEGNHRTPAFFDLWMTKVANDATFWITISSSPRFQELIDSWGMLGTRWREKVEILNKVRVGLTEAGFDVTLYSALPQERFDPANMPAVIVIDYILSTEANPEKISESTQWLSGVSQSCFNTDDSKPPLIVLISSAVKADQVDATGREFRKNSSTLSSYFRMVPKAQESFASYVVGLAKDHCTIAADRLVEFYSVYKELVNGYEKAAREIKDSISQLELEDLVTFHAAQLNNEGGTLDEYLSWLYGQVLTSKLLKQMNRPGN